jgi:hypothetical protein
MLYMCCKNTFKVLTDSYVKGTIEVSASYARKVWLIAKENL